MNPKRHQSRHQRRSGHSLIELIAAMITGSILLAGLGSVMFIADQTARVPTAGQQRIKAALIASEIADDMRHAIFLQHLSPQRIEFVVADRNGDDVAERIRYEWIDTPEDNRLEKTYNSNSAITRLVENIARFHLEPTTEPDGSISCIEITLQTGVHEHSRVATSVSLANRPQVLAHYWRHDFDRDPTQTDADANSFDDWVVDGGAFDEAWLIDGIWIADNNTVLETQPISTFTGVTTIEARFGGDKIGFRFPAYRQDGNYTPIAVGLFAEGGSRTLRLQDDAIAPLRHIDTNQQAVIENLADDFVRVRMTIDPNRDEIDLELNNVSLGSYTYADLGTASNDGSVSIGVIDGAGQFDYIDIRVRPDEVPED